MASLRKRGNVWFIRYYLDGQLVEKSLRVRKKSEAQRRLKEFSGQEARGELAESSRTPVLDFIDQFSERLKLRLPHKSYRTDAGRLRAFFEKAQVRTLEDITPQLISRILEQGLNSGWSPRTYNNYREVIHRAFSFAIREGGFISPLPGRANPASLVRRIPTPAPNIRHLALAQIDDLLNSLASKSKLQTAVATLIYTGLRRAELLWLTPEDLDLSARLLAVQAKSVDGESWEPKTKRNRSVPISASLLVYLEQWLPLRPESLWLFPGRSGRRWDTDGFSTSLRRAQEGCNPRWGCLDFRHTFASHLARKGVSLYKIAKLLGNSVQICERHYAHLSSASLHDEVEFSKG